VPRKGKNGKKRAQGPSKGEGQRGTNHDDVHFEEEIGRRKLGRKAPRVLYLRARRK